MTAAASGTLAAAAAGAYTLSLSGPLDAADAPSDAQQKAHHNKTGTGFVNPWESWKPVPPFQIVKSMFWCVPLAPRPDPKKVTQPN
jgi:N-acyl-phosphatidylethanolamine-hydrolysing phospholipase D